jgi:uncharacterized protein (TIGR00288 family)
MSPWWLRPPGEEPAEEPERQRAPEPEIEPETVRAPEPPSIADLLAPAPPAGLEALPAEAEDEEEEAEGTGEAAEEAEEAPRKRKRRRRPRRRRDSAATAESAEGNAERRLPVRAEEDDDEEDEEDDYEGIARELIESITGGGAPTRPVASPEERKLAMFCDLENLALGVRDSEVKRFDITLVLERLLEKGKIIVKRAYADWERYSEFKVAFHESAIELIDIPQRRYSGKNSADIKMVVDAMDLSYAKEHLDTFVILSGDSDFSPLVSKLKENNKYVIGIGVKNSSSNLLVDNCDEFIYYEDVWRDREKSPELTGLTKKKAEVFTLLVDAILALQRENKDVLFGSLIKQTMQRKKPSFNEGYYGYSTFTELIQDAERHQIVKLKRDQRSGTLVVTGFAKRR